MPFKDIDREWAKTDEDVQRAWQEESEITLGRRVPKQESGIGYEKLKDPFELGKPTLLTLSGAVTVEDVLANGLAKIAQQLLGRATIYDESLQILGATYPEHPTNKIRLYDDLAAHNQKAARDEDGNYEPYVERLVEKYFMPLVSDNGDKIELDAAKRNMRNINVLAYSYGSNIIDQIGNCLHEKMLDIDYSEAEIAEVTKQALVVTAGGTSSYARGRASFTKINVINLGDRAAKGRSDNIDRARESLAGTTPDKRLAILPTEKENEFLVTAGPKIKMMARTDHTGKFTDENGEFFSIDMDGAGESYRSYPVTTPEGELLMPQLLDKSGHTTYTFFSYGLGEHGLMVPNLIANLLTNGVNNSIANSKASDGEFVDIPEFEKLLVPPKQMQFRRSSREEVGVYAAPERLAENIGFVDRIKEAMSSQSQQNEV